MKKTLFLVLTALCFINVKSFAQDTLVGWTFPTGTATDVNPDHHNTANASMAISCLGGTSAIDFTKNGLTTKSAQTTGWDGGANLKYWQIEVNTTNNSDLKLYSKQTAGGANPGPRDWKAQYKLGTGGSWTDITGTTLVNANNWTSAVISNVALPSACNNQPSVFVRWLMTSDTSIAPPALVLASGTTKIDDIFVLGSFSTLVDELKGLPFSVFPNPSSGFFIINSDVPLADVSIFNLQGKQVFSLDRPVINQSIDISEMENGIYFVRYRELEGTNYLTKKILKNQ